MPTPDDEQLEAMLAPLQSWNRSVLREVESRGYRVGVACDESTWYATAKRDADGDFHRVRAESEDEVVVWLAWSVGLNLMEWSRRLCSDRPVITLTPADTASKRLPQKNTGVCGSNQHFMATLRSGLGTEWTIY